MHETSSPQTIFGDQTLISVVERTALGYSPMPGAEKKDFLQRLAKAEDRDAAKKSSNTPAKKANRFREISVEVEDPVQKNSAASKKKSATKQQKQQPANKKPKLPAPRRRSQRLVQKPRARPHLSPSLSVKQMIRLWTSCANGWPVGTC